jgi:hypothetical protein
MPSASLTRKKEKKLKTKTDVRKTIKNCQDTYCKKYTKNFIKIGNALGKGALKILKHKLDTLAKKKNKSVEEEKKIVEGKRKYDQMVKEIREKLKDKKEIQKRVKLNMEDCATKFCDPECKGTIFETRKDLAPELKEKYKDNSALITFFKSQKKNLFKGRKTVLKDGFYYKMKPKTRKALEKMGAISGCIEMDF